MIKKVLVTIAMLAMALPAAAQTTGVTEVNARPGVGANTVRPLNGIRKEAQQEVKEIRKETRKEIKEVRVDARKDIKEVRDEAKEARKDIRQQFSADAQAREVALVTLRADLKAKTEANREQLQEKLKKIKDTKKADIVAKVATSLNETNARLTNGMAEMLTKLSDILVKIDAKTDDKVAIDAARAAIVTAQAGVDAQAGKSYTVTVTTEGNLRSDTAAAAAGLKKDLAVVQTLVKAAREAVGKAYKDLK